MMISTQYSRMGLLINVQRQSRLDLGRVIIMHVHYEINVIVYPCEPNIGYSFLVKVAPIITE